MISARGSNKIIGQGRRIDIEAREMAMAAVLAIVLPMVMIEKMHKINENCTGKGDANVIVKHFY